jgi:hypothetical protein
VAEHLRKVVNETDRAPVPLIYIAPPFEADVDWKNARVTTKHTSDEDVNLVTESPAREMQVWLRLGD